MQTLKKFTPSDMPVKTDEFFWLLNLGMHNPFIWTKIIRYDGDLLTDSKVNPNHPNCNQYKIDNIFFCEAEKIDAGIIIQKHFYSDHMPTSFFQSSLISKRLDKHL